MAADRYTLAIVTANLTSANSEIASLKSKLKIQSNPTDKNRFKYGNYCWTHGFLCGKYDISVSCKFPKEGHQKEATNVNKMGGSKK